MAELGGITLSNDLGAWQLINQPATLLPQEVASGFGIAFEGFVGASYVPIQLVASQLVSKSKNYLFICEQTMATATADKHITGVIINVPFTPTNDGKGSKIVRIFGTNEPMVPNGVMSLFEATKGTILGTTSKPLVYIGQQVVKGINYYVVLETKAVVPNAVPYATLGIINVFNGQATLKIDTL